MKFKTKIIQLTVASAVSSILVTGLLSAIATSQNKAIATQIAQALAPEEVNLRAKQIIVRIDGASIGSGSILEHTGDRYTVLTNWHVMQNEGGYTVQTIDGRKHEVIPESIRQLDGLDLAILEFTSSQNYQTAELGDSGSLTEGQTVYFAGYPGELRREDNRYYRFFTANLVGMLPTATENGYSLIYNGEAFPGMSGGPVLNREGMLVGVHGEANVAFTGGTSNYAIPIATYQQAIAKLDAPQENSTADAAEATPTEETVAAEATETTDVPEVVVEQPVETSVEEPAANAAPEPDNSVTEQATETIDDNAENNAGDVSAVPTSVPTFAAEEQSKPEPEATSDQEQPEPELEPAAEPEVVKEPKTPEPEVAAQPKPELEPESESEEQEEEEVTVPTVARKIALISPKTGIDYTTLRNLLKEQKWSEADLHTYKLVEQIVKSAKLDNKRTFIELKAIAEYSCPDVRTIDYLWKKYSDDRFGFSQQQKVWQSVNQKGDFSTETWRRFATQVGWKKGEVESSSGYLLYEQLDFEPEQAPAGHLPWWFAMADEEQKVIKSLFARCNLNPTLAELEAEAKKNANTAQNTDNPDNNRRRDTDDSDEQESVDKESSQSDR